MYPNGGFGGGKSETFGRFEMIFKKMLLAKSKRRARSHVGVVCQWCFGWTTHGVLVGHGDPLFRRDMVAES